MHTARLFKTIRILLNKSQNEIANKVGIKRPSLAHWETESNKLSINTINKIAQQLQISDKFIKGQNSNPFSMPNRIIYFSTRGKNLKNDLTELLSLLPHISPTKLLALIPAWNPKRITIQEPVKAIYIMDSENNAFIITPHKSQFIIDADTLFHTILPQTANITFYKQRASDEFFNKIDIQKTECDDFNRFFVNSNKTMFQNNFKSLSILENKNHVETKYNTDKIPATTIKRKTIYLAAPFFSLAERNFNSTIASFLRAAGYEVLLPQEFNSETQDHEKYELLLKNTEKADIILAVLDGPIIDTNTSEIITKARIEKKYILGIQTDTRLSESVDTKTIIHHITSDIITYLDNDLQELLIELLDKLNKLNE